MSRKKRTLVLLVAGMVLVAWKFSPFALQPPDFRNVIEQKSGLFVHREVELRVNPARLEKWPEGTTRGAVPKLDTQDYFPLGARSSSFNPSKYERRGDHLVWRAVMHLSKDDLEGKTSLGAAIRWEREGAATTQDELEIFRYPEPKADRLDNWSSWVGADKRREGIFAWHAEANKHPDEGVAAPSYPFEMRFRLVLSRRMYP